MKGRTAVGEQPTIYDLENELHHLGMMDSRIFESQRSSTREVSVIFSPHPHSLLPFNFNPV